ncbi:MAG: type IV secretory system conjugative DNA transfer family protein [Maledivibacter sp.]|nr:type IV secretory system conjugative DNA transfer family protein [Maledivibacter sp.]
MMRKPHEDAPIMKDLYQLILEKTKKAAEYKELATLLKDIAIGGDSFLFRGHSSIKVESRCVCLDTFSLQNASDNINKTQYFNLLTWCWDIMTKDRTESVLLIADESYPMINLRVPQSLIFLRDVAKRARKYESGYPIQ